MTQSTTASHHAKDRLFNTWVANRGIMNRWLDWITEQRGSEQLYKHLSRPVASQLLSICIALMYESLDIHCARPHVSNPDAIQRRVSASTSSQQQLCSCFSGSCQMSTVNSFHDFETEIWCCLSMEHILMVWPYLSFHPDDSQATYHVTIYMYNEFSWAYDVAICSMLKVVCHTWIVYLNVTLSTHYGFVEAYAGSLQYSKARAWRDHVSAWELHIFDFIVPQTHVLDIIRLYLVFLL